MSGHQAVEAIATRVAELLAPQLEEIVRDLAAESGGSQLVGPAEIARRLGRSEDWVRQHAEELGVIRIGEGARRRLWFRPSLVEERLLTGPDQVTSAPTRVPGRRRPDRRNAGPPLLPVAGSGP